MTGLLNRTSIDELIDEKIETATSDLSIVFIDIDDFKCVNDSLGHLMGDDVTKTIDSLFTKLQKLLKCGVKITLSIGISFYPKNGLSRKELYHEADLALYSAKRSGKNGYIISNENSYK